MTVIVATQAGMGGLNHAGEVNLDVWHDDDRPLALGRQVGACKFYFLRGRKNYMRQALRGQYRSFLFGDESRARAHASALGDAIRTDETLAVRTGTASCVRQSIAGF